MRILSLEADADVNDNLGAGGFSWRDGRHDPGTLRHQRHFDRARELIMELIPFIYTPKFFKQHARQIPREKLSLSNPGT